MPRGRGATATATAIDARPPARRYGEPVRKTLSRCTAQQLAIHLMIRLGDDGYDDDDVDDDDDDADGGDGDERAAAAGGARRR